MLRSPTLFPETWVSPQRNIDSRNTFVTDLQYSFYMHINPLVEDKMVEVEYENFEL